MALIARQAFQLSGAISLLKIVAPCLTKCLLSLRSLGDDLSLLRHRADQNEIAFFVFSITAKDFSHGVLLHRVDRRSPRLALR